MNKIAVVTGGNRGLGKDMVLALAKEGKDVIFTYNSKESEAGDVVKEVENLGRRSAAIQLSVDRQEGFDAFFNELSRVLNEKFNGAKIDYWVNNAGIGLPTVLGATDESSFDTLMNIHMKSPYFLVQNALKVMNDGGAIVNIGTGLTRFSMAGYSVYGSLKAAMETMTRYWALELGKRQIRVNAVAPGAIETDFGGGMVRDNDEINKTIAAATALGRVGLPDDIGSVVAFLCSDSAKWVNGQRIEVSGGIHL
ncbi:NAD(P)-dependent dehydrogenase (short-subunit alcohol dehydrogenase family) [Chryseobacterium defluvii]|uniref:NAD(P)-dependent dehydrogenase (Short-subunit alcohol dehydrogenase family) n=1 Tax=Chryseobacterium defluvii TaxID=160396 RepID=A0A840KA89_9FLAO|nr:SDR family oxidoreductase [Chryseobacterium defluvii]MBB4804898.1 NAD(P)-dependent dehydrogenase (short-subunit alcohol dehydrogenase family) [Chryseobacterium defluvii]